MDKEALNKAAKEAVDHWSNEEFEQAEQSFRLTLPFIDDNNWQTVNYLTCFACNQNSLGKTDEATVLLERSLKSALATDSEESITVTCARLCLANQLYEQGEVEAALSTIQASLDIDCDGKDSLLLLFARLQLDLGNVDVAEAAAEQFLQLKPDGKLKTLEEVLYQVKSRN